MRCGDELITETEAGEGILANDTNKDGYAETARQKSPASTALKLGLVSAASAIVGGLAAAWWYRRTLSKFQNPIAIEDQSGVPYRKAEEETVVSSEEDDLPHLISD